MFFTTEQCNTKARDKRINLNSAQIEVARPVREPIALLCHLERKRETSPTKFVLRIVISVINSLRERFLTPLGMTED